MNEEKLLNAVRNKLDQVKAADYEEITCRRCSNDNHDGVEITIAGFAVPLLPVFDVVGDLEDWKIASAGMYMTGNRKHTDGGETEYEPAAVLFCADVSDDNLHSEVFV